MSRNFISDEHLIDRLPLNDTAAFEELYSRYCFPLYKYCKNKLNSDVEARNIVRDIFIALWEGRKSIPADFSISVHLYTEVRKAVVKCVDEKLTLELKFVDVDRDIIPSFSLKTLLNARKPVTPRIVFNERVVPKNADDLLPWWNRTPVFPQMKSFRHAFNNMLNFF